MNFFFEYLNFVLEASFFGKWFMLLLGYLLFFSSEKLFFKLVGKHNSVN